MKTRFVHVGFMVWAGIGILNAAPLTESTFTDVIHDVNVVSAADRSAEPAKMKEVFKMPDLVRTGPDSRAELTAPDQTITRIGANSVFSFAPTGREINLEQGSVLFHSPHGKGGGTIRSGGASAAVTGTTIIVATVHGRSEGDERGFKVIILEGSGKVTLLNGRSITLKAGQMIYILPGQTDFGLVITINLSKLVEGSLLIKGFGHDLPSIHLIELAIGRQGRLLLRGLAQDTGISADTFAGWGNGPQYGISGSGNYPFDPNTYRSGTLYHAYNGPGNGSSGPTIFLPPPVECQREKERCRRVCGFNPGNGP